MIRKALQSDVDEIWSLGSNVDEFQVSKEVVTFWPRPVLEACVNNGSIFVFEENKKIIGFIISNYNPLFKKAIIENIFVHQEHRNKGIGKNLLNNLLKDLKIKKCEYVCTLIEEKDDLGKAFYLKNKFNKGIDCVWLDLILGTDFKKP